MTPIRSSILLPVRPRPAPPYFPLPLSRARTFTGLLRDIIPPNMRRGRTACWVLTATCLTLFLVGCAGWAVYATDVEQHVNGEPCYKAWSPDSDQVAICPSGCYILGPGNQWYLPDDTPLKNTDQLCAGARKVLHARGYL